jgi:integrase
MSVRRRKWLDPKTGVQKEAWVVDVDFTSPDGAEKRVRKTPPVQTRRGAEEYERQLRTSLLDGSYVANQEEQENPVPTLEAFSKEFFRALRNQQKPPKESTLAEYQAVFNKHLAPRLGHKRLDQIVSEDVAMLKAALTDRSNKTVNNVLVVLSKCLQVAKKKWPAVEKAGCEIHLLQVQQGVPGFYEFEELDKLAAAAQVVDARIYVAVLLGAHAGLRSGEMQGLEWRDVDLRRGIITVQRRVHKGNIDSPKSGKMRRINMTARLQAALEGLPRGLAAVRVLRNDEGGPITQRILERWMGKAQKAAGHVVTNRIHVLRHTFCSHLAMRSAPSLAIKELAGHIHLSTTQRYMHLSDAERQRAIGLLDQPAPPAPAGERHIDGTKENARLGLGPNRA